MTARARTTGFLLGLSLVLVAPLAVAAVALREPAWFPVLDLAMTELRVRDAFGPHTPLIGLPGRIGSFPDQGSHPGPLSFYALAPAYRLLGSSSWSLQVATLAVNAIAVTVAVVLAHRRAGPGFAAGVAAVVAVLMRGYGIETLAEPWNPYLPLMSWVVVLLGVWSVVCGDVRVLPVTALAATLCAQTHVPYLGLCLVLGAVALAAVVARWWRARRSGGVGTAREAERWAAVSVALLALLWAPLVADQLTNEPGNLTMLWRHFASPPEPPVGLRAGARLLLLHLDPAGFVAGEGGASGSLVQASSDPDGSVLPGLAVLALFAGSAAFARRRGRTELVLLHVVVAAALIVATYSMARIFGKVWYYLMLWAWGIVALLVVAVGWTAVHEVWARLGAERARAYRRLGAVALGSVALVSSLALIAEAAAVEPPAPRLSAVLAEVIPPTARVLDEDARYLVTWSDAF